VTGPSRFHVVLWVAGECAAANLASREKWVELLKAIAPHVARVAMFFNPASATYAEYWLKPFKSAAASFGVEAISAPVHDGSELDSVFAAQAREPKSGLIAMPDPFTLAHRVEIVSLAARYRLPVVYPYRFFAEVGGLLADGVDLADNFRRGDLCRSHPQGREAERASRPGSGQIRACDQPQGCQGTRLCGPGDLVGDSRQGD
jgi:ABC transporter substrate binding protein